MISCLGNIRRLAFCFCEEVGVVAALSMGCCAKPFSSLVAAVSRTIQAERGRCGLFLKFHECVFERACPPARRCCGEFGLFADKTGSITNISPLFE